MKRIGFFLGFLIMVTHACQNHSASSGQEKESPRFIIESLDSPTGLKSEEPNLFIGGDGNLYMSWVVKDSVRSGILKFAVFQKNSWGPSMEIARGTDWFVNWADFPAMAVDKLGNKFATYLPKSSQGTYSYDVGMVAYEATHDTWLQPQILNDDGFLGEHGFVSAISQSDSGFFVCWLDGRQGAEKGPMSIRGAFLQADMTKVQEDALDLRVCDCCQTTAVWADAGPVVFYRDRSDEEIRDIYTVHWEDGSWSEPICVFPDNWEINGCPVNGPRADVIGNSLAVAWFSMPDDTAEVKCIFSDDGGKTFQSPFLLSRGSSLGRVDVAMIDNGKIAVSWLEETETSANIMVALVDKQNGILFKDKIVETNALRASGFPQLTYFQQKLFLAWTESENPSQVKMKRIAFNGI